MKWRGSKEYYGILTNRCSNQRYPQPRKYNSVIFCPSCIVAFGQRSPLLKTTASFSRRHLEQHWEQSVLHQPPKQHILICSSCTLPAFLWISLTQLYHSWISRLTNLAAPSLHEIAARRSQPPSNVMTSHKHWDKQYSLCTAQHNEHKKKGTAWRIWTKRSKPCNLVELAVSVTSKSRPVQSGGWSHPAPDGMKNHEKGPHELHAA